MRKCNLIFLIIFLLASHLPLARAGEEFVYKQKLIGQVKAKPVRIKVIVSRFETELEMDGSPFNPLAPRPKEKSDAKDINLKIDDSLAVLEAEIKKTENYSDADLLVGLLTDKLRKSGYFDVVERQDVNELVREINFENSSWAKKDNVGKLGNISGAQYIILGKLLSNKGGQRISPARYSLSLRLCNINTGEILASSSSQHDTVQGAVEESVQQMVEEVHNLPWTCRVAKVEPLGLLINAGFSDGLKRGDVFAVLRLGEDIKDPVTGVILGSVKEEIAKVRVYEILENNLSRVKIINSNGEIKVGDIVAAKIPEQTPDEISKWRDIFSGSGKENKGTPSIKLETGSVRKMSHTDSLASDIAAQFAKSIVLINSGSAQGSGFIVTSDGYILTNAHVVDGQKSVAIKLIDENIVYSNVEVVKVNPIRDMALLKIKDAGSFVPVILGDSDQAQVGEHVVVISNPKGLENTVADGLISAIREADGTKLIQISVPITHGSSGGAMFNSHGEVIGITSMGLGEANLNFGVAINHAKNELLK